MGHMAYSCSHRKGAHKSEVDQDEDNGVTRVGKKTFLRPKPQLWLPPDITDFLNMKAIQQTMITRHTEDRARVEALSNNAKSEDHKDPSTPITVHIDVEPPVGARTIHPDLEDWKKANNKSSTAKPQKKQKHQKNPTQEPHTQPQQEPSFQINDLPPKSRPRKENPIPNPGENHGMQTDFNATQFHSYKKFNPPKQATSNSKQGIHNSFWNPHKDKTNHPHTRGSGGSL
ncbi:hypothetical protein DSO57_1001722 [Entomophthora muscae]|uniref:Uncharacterized protein n=1 Tax=Entomophthora muscae TaxID=34485 RepID=A0ACC2SLY5_9FUNG|nr:hypothetical protein DSO57_1001722 [Entomophthora muscae]